MQTENYRRPILIGLVLTLVTIAALGIAWVTEPARMAEAKDTTTRASVLLGRQVYVANCTPCHGTRGEGGVGPALNDKNVLGKGTNEVLAGYIAVGRPNTLMPAWAQLNGGPLTDEDIRNVVSFIRAWEPTAPTIATGVVISDAARGLSLFNGTCFVCHGENGKGGGIAPAINNPARLSALDDNWYRQTIAIGRPARGMPTWGTVLAPSQIEDLIALIGAWRKGEPVATTTTVADLLDQTLFALSQKDDKDALFYLNRAKPLAFGPGKAQLDPILATIQSGDLTKALNDLGAFRKQWPLGDATKGTTVFKDACSGCHGADGQGGVGRRLKPNAFIQSSTNADVMTLILTGRVNTAMRGWAGRLTEEQIADVIAFLRTWQ
jgi:cbb3-type cytochrome c oxidase subunit III